MTTALLMPSLVRRAASGRTITWPSPSVASVGSSPNAVNARPPVIAVGQRLGLAEQQRHFRRGRFVPECLRRAALHDAPPVHHRDGVGQLHGFFRIVGDHDGRGGVLSQRLAGALAQFPAQGGVDAGEGFIQQHHGGFRCQRPRQRDPLLLTAGKRMGVATIEAAQPDGLELRGDATAALCAFQLTQAERHVAADVQVREQHVVLKHQADGTLFRWWLMAWIGQQIVAQRNPTLLHGFQASGQA